MAPSTSPELRTVRVVVRTGSPLAEVFLIDHAFALVRRSVGDLDTTVDPGVYKAKAKLADAETERLLLCDEDREIDLSEELRVASPAPLSGTTRERSMDAGLTRNLSASIRGGPSSAAEVLLVTRRWTPSPVSLDASLHDSSGLLVPFPTTAEGPAADGAGSAVDAGSYFLRWHGAGDVAVEQTIQATAGWQTQVFVLDEPGEGSGLGATRVSVQMSRAGFDPASAELRRAEEARTALAEERKISSPALEDILERSDNPMLGLFGAHLMLLTRETAQRRSPSARPQAPVRFDAARFERLVMRLQSVLGLDHPDVVALTTQLPGPLPTSLGPISAPPMLWRSWLLLVEASNDTPMLVSPSVWRRAVGSLPLRPFLIWMTDAADSADRLERVIARALELEGPNTDVRRQLTSRLLVPRSVVDSFAPDR
ncbi:MAG TPA: hypothetical protein VEQ66_00035 [Propionibacteriaceae bacterium]|nr:hypothetical protein [Propionibacteriaceae bacterium]